MSVYKTHHPLTAADTTIIPRPKEQYEIIATTQESTNTVTLDYSLIQIIHLYLFSSCRDRVSSYVFTPPREGYRPPRFS